MLLTSADAGRLIKRTPATIRRAAVLGRLRVAAVTSGGERLFLRDDVLEYRARMDAVRAAGGVVAADAAPQ